MQTTHPDVFALENSDLEAFLYAVVGKELNGSALTILSMTARLGCDPWAEAARWATLPRAGVIASLTKSIGLMPLVPSALTDAPATAARLVQLLPAVTPGIRQGGSAKAGVSSIPEWLPVTLLYCAIACGMAISALFTPKPNQAIAAPAEQSAAVAGTMHTAPAQALQAGPLPGTGAASTGPRTK